MPNYRISVPAAAIKRGGEGGDSTPPVESYDLGQKIKAAVACGIFATIGLGVLWSGLTLPGLFIERWLKGIAVIIGVGFAVTCGLGIWWAFSAAYRPWGIDNKVRKRAWKFEDALHEAQIEAAKRAKDKIINEDDNDGIPWTLNDKQRLDLLAVKVFDRAYNKGLPVTREAMCTEGLCTQEDWNLVTKALKALGLKERYTMQSIDFSMAWAAWQEGFKIEEDHIWAMKPNGEWKALERIG